MNKYFLLIASALLVNQVSYGMEENTKEKIKEPQKYLSYKPGFKLFGFIIKKLTGKNIYEKNNKINLTKINQLKETPIHQMENDEIFKSLNLDELDYIVQVKYAEIKDMQEPAEGKNVHVENLKRLYKKTRTTIFSGIAQKEYENSDDTIKNKFADLLLKVDSITNEQIVNKTVSKEYRFRKDCGLSSFKGGSYKEKKAKKLMLESVEDKTMWQRHGGKVLLTGAVAFVVGTAYWYKSK